MKRNEIANSLRRLAHCEGMGTCEDCPFDPELCRSEDTAVILLEAAELLSEKGKIRETGTQRLGKVLADRLTILRAESGLSYQELLEAIRKYFYTDEYGSKHAVSRDSLVFNELNGGRRNRGNERFSVELLVWYANVFGVSTDWILGLTDRRD